MKNPLQTLLIVLALSLCALCVYQWHVEAGLRTNIQKREDVQHDLKESIQALQADVKRNNEEIKRLDGLKNELTETVKSNKTQIAKMMKDLEKGDLEVEKGLKIIEAHKAALAQANEAIKKQNEDVKKQNEDMKKLSDDRNEAVVKYNKLITEFNELAQKWNDAQAAATNAPPAKK
ncbi:MAG: hypothetical protein EXS35_03205 [Pedosphaera sp.]|nr:hypothetical protein [Pedosphaera sp.]